MMKSKRFLRSLVKPGPLCILPLLILFLASCKPIEPTYKDKDIPAHIQRICKDEYGLDVVVKRTNDTLWICMPLTKLLHEKFNVEKNNIFSETTKTTLMNILTSVSRVILSSDKSPDFYCLTASDIEAGIDYSITGYALDIKKASAGFIPSTELNRRYVIKIDTNLKALADNTGAHINTYDINFTDFLISQILQRIAMTMQSEELKDCFKIEALDGEFKNKIFSFTFKIRELSPPKQKIDINNEVLKVAAYCINTYELNNYLGVEIEDLNTGRRDVVSPARIKKLASEL